MLFVEAWTMGAGREDVAEAGRWLAGERLKRSYHGRPLSTSKLASFANDYIVAGQLPVKQLHQQEISNLENATLDRGPKRLQPWFQVLRRFIESGELDARLALERELAADESADGVVVKISEELVGRAHTIVRTPDGKVVGEIVWRKK